MRVLRLSMTGQSKRKNPKRARVAPTTTYESVPITHQRSICCPERQAGRIRPRPGTWCSSRISTPGHFTVTLGRSNSVVVASTRLPASTSPASAPEAPAAGTMGESMLPNTPGGDDGGERACTRSPRLSRSAPCASSEGASPQSARLANFAARRSGPPPQTRTNCKKEKITTDSYNSTMKWKTDSTKGSSAGAQPIAHKPHTDAALSITTMSNILTV
mmetsp:Transcript_76382/g.220756  ORF Transcript_76382/g.220756 Transcript_76382/m.220756 type:complete len:217 (+) Transcript_76382:884-1534(+)